jgi:hypothetical protein
LAPIKNEYSHVPSRVYESKPKAVLKDQTNYQLPEMGTNNNSDRGIAKNKNIEDR